MFKLFHKEARLDIRGAPDGVLSMLWDWHAIENGTAGETRVGMTDEGLEHSERSGQLTGEYALNQQCPRHVSLCITLHLPHTYPVSHMAQ